VTSEFFSFLIENWAFGLLKNNLCLPCVQQSNCHCQPAILPQSKLICRVLNLDHETLTLSGWSLPLIHWSSQLLPFSCLSLRIDCPFFIRKTTSSVKEFIVYARIWARFLVSKHGWQSCSETNLETTLQKHCIPKHLNYGPLVLNKVNLQFLFRYVVKMNIKKQILNVEM